MNYPRILRQEHALAEATTVHVQKDSKILAVRLLRAHRQRMYRVTYFEFWYSRCDQSAGRSPRRPHDLRRRHRESGA